MCQELMTQLTHRGEKYPKIVLSVCHQKVGMSVCHPLRKNKVDTPTVSPCFPLFPRYVKTALTHR